MTREFSITQTARICWMAGRGCTSEEIAADRMVACSPNEIKFYVDRLDLSSLVEKHSPAPLRIELEREIALALDVAAAIRKIGRVEMAERLLTAVLGGELVGAVLDDGMAAS